VAGPSSDVKWQIRIVRAGMPGLNRLPDLLGVPELGRLPGMGHLIRPADIGEGLRAALLARENMLEDSNYQKVVPNLFIVEIGVENYRRQFRPIERQVIDQWQELLLSDLITANSRQGRKEFRLGGRLQIEVRPAQGLKDTEARILSRIEADSPVGGAPQPSSPQGRPRPVRQAAPSGPEPGAAGAFIELYPSGQRWALYPGMNTIGRSETNQIFLDLPEVQQRRLVSGQHAYILMDGGECFLFDGSPDGKPSVNGTYVNGQRVSRQGHRLQNGDVIILAAVDPAHPSPDTPGAAAFYFRTGSRG